MAGYTGLTGTRLVAEAKNNRAILTARFSPAFLHSLDEREPYDLQRWLTLALTKKNDPITAWEYAGEGGIFAALWNLSGIFNAGIDVDIRLLPMQQITVEVCELFELNPYRLLCGNCAVFAAWGGNRILRELEAEGIPAAVIGSVSPGIARHIRHGNETAGYLERPQLDELYKIIEQAERKSLS